MPTEEKHEIKMMYAVYADGRKEPIVINEIKDLSLEEAKPILEEHNFVKVIRCKDCKHFHDGIYNGEYWMECDEYRIALSSDEWFCANGERREDEPVN